MYGDGTMAVSKADFEKWAMNIRHNVVDKNGGKGKEWKFPVP